MKKMYAFLLFALVTLSAAAQTTFKQLNEQQIKTMLCHKWKLSYLEGKGKKFNVPGSQQLTLGFKPDGTLAEFDGKKNYTGSWSYKHTTFTITTNDQDGIENYDLVNLTGNVLVMKTTIKGIPVNMGLQLVD